MADSQACSSSCKDSAEPESMESNEIPAVIKYAFVDYSIKDNKHFAKCKAAFCGQILSEKFGVTSAFTK
jgi:hypothetical protein